MTNVLDLFAGAGGWDEGLRLLGMDCPTNLGVELDRHAVATARAAGHARLQADITTLDTADFAGTVGLIASPPCQAWSMAGNRLGVLDQPSVHELVDRVASGDDSLDWATWHDQRSHLVVQPLRFVRDLRPEWIALEEVRAVMPLWEHIGTVLGAMGYSVWAGVLNSADYGVPQTRKRAILMAHRTRPVHPPIPTHSRVPGLFTDPWVTMGEALGWGFDKPSATVSGGGAETGGPEVFGNADCRRRLLDRRTNSTYGGGRTAPSALIPGDRPGPTVTGSAHLWRYRASSRPNAALRGLDEPAPTVLFGHSSNDVSWVHERPATTIAGTNRVARPGHRDRAGGERQWDESARVSLEDAATLQGFPADYPWQGTKGARFLQVGNAIPPPLAAAIVHELIHPTTT